MSNCALIHEPRHFAADPTTMPGCPVVPAPPNRRNPASGSDGRTRSAPPTTARAPTSRCSPASPRASSCACSTTTATRTRTARADRGRRPLLARLPARRPARASATATASTGRGTRRTGCAATPPSCSSTRTPRPSTARSTGPRRASATTSTTRTAEHGRQRPPRASGVVSDPFFDWGNDRPPAHGMHETIIYEAHVKGLTVRHPGVPRRAARHVRGVAHPADRRAPHRLGVTAVELMPVHQFVHDPHLVERGLRNYWGYNSIGYLAPHDGYASPAVARRPGSSSTTPPRARCRSSRRWSRPCTRPASR